MKTYVMDDFFPGTRPVRVYDEVAPTLRINCGASGLSIVTSAVHEADGQDVTVQEEVAYALVTGGGKPGQGYPCVMIKELGGEDPKDS